MSRSTTRECCLCGQVFIVQTKWDGRCPRCEARARVESVTLIEWTDDGDVAIEVVSNLTHSQEAVTAFLVEHGCRRLGYQKEARFHPEALGVWRGPRALKPHELASVGDDSGVGASRATGEVGGRVYWLVCTVDAWTCD